MKAILEQLLEREIEALLRTLTDDTNADYLAGKLLALRWALAKVRRRQRQSGKRNFRQLAPTRTPVL
jgi:hypothetical protein